MAKTAQRTKKEAVRAQAIDPTARLNEVTAALDPTAVIKIPSHPEARLSFLGLLARAAGQDAELLLQVPLPDGALEPWEVELLPLALATAKDLGAQVSADKLSAGQELSRKDAAMLAQVRADQALLLSAFRRLRFKGQAGKLKELRAIEAGQPDDLQDAEDDSTRLLALVDHQDHSVWVAKLPLGEPAAVERLRAAHPRLTELAATAQDRQASAARRDRLRRLWTIIASIERRLRDAGDYAFHGKARREAYAAFKKPATRRKGKSTKAPRPASPKPPAPASP